MVQGPRRSAICKLRANMSQRGSVCTESLGQQTCENYLIAHVTDCKNGQRLVCRTFVLFVITKVCRDSWCSWQAQPLPRKHSVNNAFMWYQRASRQRPGNIQSIEFILFFKGRRMMVVTPPLVEGWVDSCAIIPVKRREKDPRKTRWILRVVESRRDKHVSNHCGRTDVTYTEATAYRFVDWGSLHEDLRTSHAMTVAKECLLSKQQVHNLC